MDLVSIALALVAFAVFLPPDRGAGPRMSAAELFGLIVSVAVFGYLCYALLPG